MFITNTYMDTQLQPEKGYCIKPVILPNLGQIIGMLFQEKQEQAKEKDGIAKEKDKIMDWAEFYKCIAALKKEYPDIDPHLTWWWVPLIKNSTRPNLSIKTKIIKLRGNYQATANQDQTTYQAQ